MENSLKKITVWLFILLLTVVMSCGSNGGGDSADTGNNNDDTPQIFMVSSLAPEDNTTDVFIGSAVNVTLSDDVDASTVDGSAFYIIDNTDLSTVSGSISFSADLKTITFTPTGGYFNPATSYTVYLTDAITSALGVALEARSFGFTTTLIATTEAAALYEMIFTNFESPTIIDMRDQAEIANGAIASSVFISYDDLLSGLNLPTNLSTQIILISSDGSDGIIAASLLGAEGYTNVTTLYGGIASWSDAGYPLQDGSEGDFYIVSLTPESGAYGVPVNETISVTFSENINPATVNLNSFKIRRGADGSVVQGIFNVDGSVVTFIPDTVSEYPYNLLYPGEQYQIVLENIADFNNNYLPITIYAFTTTNFSRMSVTTVRGLTSVPNDNYYIVDLRDFITDGLVRYSNYVPYDMIMSGDFELLPADRTKSIIFISQDGWDSEVIASFVTNSGYTNVRTMEGGIDKWVDTGYALTHVYFTLIPDHAVEGPLWVHFDWESVGTTATVFEYKLESRSEVIVDWTSTTLKGAAIYININEYYIFSLKIAGEPDSYAILRGFEVYGCG